MSNDIGKNITNLFSKAIDLEVGTPAGRYNVMFTIIIAIILLVLLISDIPISIINALFFHKETTTPSLKECMITLGFFGGTCFLYMIFIADKQQKVKSSVNAELQPKSIDKEIAVEIEK